MTDKAVAAEILAVSTELQDAPVERPTRWTVTYQIRNVASAKPRKGNAISVIHAPLTNYLRHLITTPDVW